MSFGNCQVTFSNYSLMEKIVAHFIAQPNFKYDGTHLIYAENILSAKQWFNHVNEALNAIGVEYTHESLKTGRYLNDVFIIDNQYALNIASLRRGGRGILLIDTIHLEYMRGEDRETRTKADAKKKVIATLTPEQRKALGL